MLIIVGIIIAVGIALFVLLMGAATTGDSHEDDYYDEDSFGTEADDADLEAFDEEE